MASNGSRVLDHVVVVVTARQIQSRWSNHLLLSVVALMTTDHVFIYIYRTLTTAYHVVSDLCFVSATVVCT